MGMKNQPGKRRRDQLLSKQTDNAFYQTRRGNITLEKESYTVMNSTLRERT